MRLFDLSAIGLSGLCLVHCLVLPVVAVFLPALAILSHAEWVHAAFVVFAIPITGLALWSANRCHRLPRVLMATAVLGLACLMLGALGWPHPDLEEMTTVCGSLLLAATHLWNWRRTRHAHRLQAS